MNSNRFASILIALIAIALILFWLKDVLLPFVLALIIWSLIRSLRAYAKGLTTLDDWMPNWLSGGLSFVLAVAILSVLVHFLAENISGITERMPTYQATLDALRDNVAANYGIDISEEITEYWREFDLSNILTTLINSFTSLFGNVFLVLIYVAFIMIEERFFQVKMKAFFKDEDRRARAQQTLNRMDRSLSKYMGLKTLVSLMTGVLSYLALLIIGVDFAFFWAFLIFVLNFIPNIGSLIGTLFPVLIAGLEFNDWQHPLAVLVSVGAIQVLVGNIVEPRLMGNSLNVSALVVILALVFWGFLWGIIGMILSVPIMVMLVIILAQYPSTRGVAIMLSERGNVDEGQ